MSTEVMVRDTIILTLDNQTDPAPQGYVIATNDLKKPKITIISATFIIVDHFPLNVIYVGHPKTL